MRRRQVDPSSQPHVVQRVREGGLAQLGLAIPALYLLGGVAVAALTLSVDAALGDSVPALLRFGAQNARTMLGSLAGALVTVTALVFWVRILAVQFSSEQFSSRTLRYFLHDPVQQHALGALGAGLVYLLLVLQALPDQQAGLATVPHISVGVSVLVGVGAAALIVVAIYFGAQQSRIGHLVRWLTDQVVEGIRRDHPERGDPPQDPMGQAPATPPSSGTGHAVLATTSGWVQRIDENRLLAALPEGATAELTMRAGVFVVAGTPLARVWPDEQAADAEPGIRAAVRQGKTPTMEQDLAYGLRQLVDIAERSLSTGVGDSTAAYEVIVHLGMVLRELLLRDLPVTTIEDQHGRRLLRPREYALSDYVDLAVSRIRLAALDWPETSLALLDTLGMLVREMDNADLPKRAEYLREHAQLVLAGLGQQDLLEWDKQRIRRQAAAQGLATSSQDEPASYPT